MSKIQLGILGAGHLGKIHLKLAQELNDDFEIVGFFDPDESKVIEAKKQFGLTPYPNMQELLEHCDAVDIVTPTPTHFECAQLALRNHKHVFIEKPITNTLEEAKKLINLAHEAQVALQVGHVERFNPAFRMAESSLDQVMFVEAHRLAEYNPRGTDVSVVLDLMIHDIDIVLSVVKANLRNTHASGVAVISDTPDICNARLEFDNGCVANLTASRISLKNMRRSRFFQKNAYISVDFMERKTEIVQLQEPDPTNPFSIIINPGENGQAKQLVFEKPDVPETNAIKEELKMFAQSIKTGEKPVVSGDDGYGAMLVAQQILEQLEFSNSIFAR